MRGPSLVIGGAKDIHCAPEDARTIAALDPNAEAYVLDDLTHILRRDVCERSLLVDPKLLEKPVDEELLELVVGWTERLRDRG